VTLNQPQLALGVGAALSALLVAAALLGLVWTPWPTDALDIANRLAAPSAAHSLGTDALGRDVASIILGGASTSLAVSLLAVGIGAGVGVPAGLVAAMRGGWADEAVGRLGDLVFAFPALLSAILLTAIAGPSVWNAVAAIGLFNIPVFARVARAGAQGLMARDFVLAARAAGRSGPAIAVHHLLPNLAGLLVVQATIQFALGILAEAGLAYVGLGAQPPRPSWGRMLAEAQTHWAAAPWLALAPGLAILLSVLGLNLLGDGLRDRLDARR
jgi:peptide/nickel transport system permease protein